jgi:hypothetical protein
MAELITTLQALHITCVATSGSTISGRGYRCAIQSDGSYNIAGIGEPGQVVSDQPSDTGNGQFLGVRIGQSGSIPAITVEPSTVGAVAYTAALGQFGVTATSAVRIGLWSQAAATSGSLGIVEPD